MSRARALSIAGVVVIAVLAVGLAYAPLVAHPNSTVLLEPGDLTSSARDYWAAHYQHQSPFTLVRDKLFAAPTGRAMAPAVQIANALQPAFVLTVRPVTGYLGAFNLFMLLGIVASLALMYFFLRRLSFHPVAAAAGAVGFASSQWSVEQLLYGHVAFAQLWVFPLLLWTIMWARRGSVLRAIAPGVAYAISFYTFSYLGLIVTGTVFVLALASIPELRSTRRLVLRVLVAATAAGVAMLPALVAPRLAPSANLGLPQINRGDLIGANFEDFFVPSSRQPLYGAVVRSVYGVHVGERAAFFGYVLLILGLITAVRVFANFRAANPILRFAALAVPLGWLMSLPAEPKIFGRTVPLPDAAFVIGTFTSWWRIYSRFILLAGLGLSILSAYALTRLLGSPRASSRYLAYALAGLIVLEALPGLPPPTSRLRVDGLTRWLAEHPGGSVATYPLAAGVTTPRDWGKIYWGSYYLQIYHRHPIFAAVDPSMVYPSILGLTQALVGDLSNNRTPGMLRTAGVRWVILRLPLYRASHQRVPRIPRGLRPVASFPGARVYEVVAPPLDLAELVNEHPKRLARAFAIADPPLSFGRGFYAPEAFNGYIAARWMRQDAKLRVRPLVPRPFVKYLVSMQVLSAGGARKLTVLDGSRVVGTFDVQTFDLPFRFRTTFPGIDSTLTFHVDPGPQQISESDRRVVSVLVESVRISPVGLHLKAEPSSGPK